MYPVTRREPGREPTAAEAELLVRALTALHAVYEVPNSPWRPLQGCARWG